MMNLTTGKQGEIALPQELREKYGLRANTPIRIIATRSGILIIPLTTAPMSAELKKELEDWQLLGAETLEAYPYEDPAA